MEWMTSNSLLMMQQSMRFLWTKQSAILDNLANVETPGYKAKYVTFEEELRAKLQSAVGGQKAVSSMRETLADAGSVIHEATSESTRMDENGVDATAQGVELSRNALQQQYVIGAITTDLAILRSAIRGQ